MRYIDDLRKDGYATFFLFKVGIEFFVAHVRVDDSGRLEAYVGRLSDGFVWDAECRDRFVLPQLPMKNLDTDTLTLKSFVTELKDLIKKYE